ncbi:MAG: MBL fold metallo-hydrolase [Desulfobacteraceae bacterium]|nr:MAG: MBL fold metallo-hydrolase [Desulfobacteraceae bacterium]
MYKQKEGTIVRIRVPGKIGDRLWMLGLEESCIYVVEGEKESIIINGGLSYVAPDLIRQFDQYGIDESRIKGILVLHAHFDHMGIVPFFKRRRPEIRVYGSERACEIFKNPKGRRVANEFSRLVAERVGRAQLLDEYDLSWNGDVEGTVLSEGDCIDLGGATLRIYETPGHSLCSIAAYMQESKALFASDSIGIPFKEIIETSPAYNYADYMESLEKLKNLEVDLICADHYGYITGEEAREYVVRTIIAARETYSMMKQTFRRAKSVEKAAEEWTRTFCKERPDYLLTPEILKKVNEQIFSHLAQEPEPAVD